MSVIPVQGTEREKCISGASSSSGIVELVSFSSNWLKAQCAWHSEERHGNVICSLHTYMNEHAHMFIYTHAKKIDTVNPNTASDFPRGNIPEGNMGDITWPSLWPCLCSYLHKRETALVFLDNDFRRTIVQPLAWCVRMLQDILRNWVRLQALDSGYYKRIFPLRFGLLLLYFNVNSVLESLGLRVSSHTYTVLLCKICTVIYNYSLSKTGYSQLLEGL